MPSRKVCSWSLEICLLTAAISCGLLLSSVAHAAGSINYILPDTATAGGATFTITVKGAGFQVGSVVYWNSTALSTNGVRAGNASASVPASLIASAGVATITVLNPDGTRSNGTKFSVVTTPPNPVLTAAATLYGLGVGGVFIVGSQLEPGATAFWNGVSLGTPPLSGVIFANVPLSLFQDPGPVGVAMSNPGGGLSNVITFTVPPVSALTSLTPPSVALNGAGFTLTVNGANFSPTDLIQTAFGGKTVDATTQFISSTQLQTFVPASALTAAGTFPIWVDNRIVVAGSFPGESGPVTNDFSSANQLYLTVGPSPSCTYSLPASSATVGTAASTGSVQVTTQASCAWTATSPSNVVSITGGASGTGNGTVTYRVAASNSAQSVTLTIAGLPFTINQVPGCIFGLTPANAALAAPGAGGSFAVGVTGANCAWTAASNAPWLVISSGASGTGNGTVSYAATPNAASVGRPGTITAGGQTFTVVQAGNAPCTYSLLAGSAVFGSAAGTGTATVQAPAGCTWTASSNVQWLSVNGSASGSGNGTVSYTVAANPAPGPRTGSLTIAGLTYAVTQAGTGSTLSCSANAPAPAQIALEGRTEVLGDLELSCTGLSGPVKADIELTLNTNVTSTLTGPNTTDAVLLVDEANPQNGQISGYGTLRWPGVTLAADSSGTATVRITNVRADASLLTAPASLQSVAVTGLVVVESEVPVPVSNAQATMANAAPALVFQAGTAASLRLPLVFEEATPAAFQAGTTRLRAVIGNIQPGDTVFVPVYPSEGAAEAQLYSADANGAGGTPVTGTLLNGLMYQQLVVTNGVATATWVVLSANPEQLETRTFLLLLGSGTESDLNQIQATGSLGPVSTVGVASATAPVPRYRDFSAPQKLVNLRVTTSLGVSVATGHLKTLAGTAGSNLTFTTTVLNDDSTQTATNVTVRDNVTTGSTIVSCSSSDGQSCGSGNLAAVSYSALGPGASETVTVVVAPGASLADGAVVDNDVGVSSDDPDANLSGTSASTASIVLNGVPVAVTDQPASGTGGNQAFTFQFSHPDGYQDLGVVNVLINNVLDGRSACYLAYSVAASTLYLVDDAGDAGGPYAGAAPLGSTSTIQNSQCTVGLVSAEGSGTTLTLILNITFQAGFGGDRIFYVAGGDFVGHNTNWQALGVWQVPGAAATGTIGVTGVAPARGTAPAGTPQTLTITLTDSKGVGDFGVVNVLINSAIDGRQACYLAYAAASNTLYLVDDAGEGGGPFAGAMALNGTSGSIQNSQCIVNGTGSTVTPSPNTLAVGLNVTFTSAFTGNRTVYVAGRDNAGADNTGWQAAGTVTVQ